MKKIKAVIFLLLSLCLVTSCDQARLRNIDDKINQLEQEDQKILKELSDAIDELEKTLLGKIQESNEKLNGDIDAAVMDMMLYLKQKMEANQDFLESELARRKQECDETVQALRNRADDVIADLDKALDNTNIRIQQAIIDNDKDLQSKLSLLQSSIGDAYDCVDAAEANLKKWENAIKQFEATGMYDQIDAMQALMKKIVDYDVQSSIDAVEQYAKDFARVKLDKLSKDKQEEIHDLFADMDGWVDEAQDYAANGESMVSEMESLLEDWRDRAEDMYSSVDGMKDAIIEGYEEIIALYDDVIDNVDFQADNIVGELDRLQAYQERINDCVTPLDNCIGILEEDAGEMDSMESALEQAASEVFAEAERILEACMKTEDWLNENEWAWDVV